MTWKVVISAFKCEWTYFYLGFLPARWSPFAPLWQPWVQDPALTATERDVSNVPRQRGHRCLLSRAFLKARVVSGTGFCEYLSNEMKLYAGSKNKTAFPYAAFLLRFFFLFVCFQPLSWFFFVSHTAHNICNRNESLFSGHFDPQKSNSLVLHISRNIPSLLKRKEGQNIHLLGMLPLGKPQMGSPLPHSEHTKKKKTKREKKYFWRDLHPIPLKQYWLRGIRMWFKPPFQCLPHGSSNLPLRHRQMILTSSETENVLIRATWEKETSCLLKPLKGLKCVRLVKYKQVNKIISHMNIFYAKGSMALESIL